MLAGLRLTGNGRYQWPIACTHQSHGQCARDAARECDSRRSNHAAGRSCGPSTACAAFGTSIRPRTSAITFERLWRGRRSAALPRPLNPSPPRRVDSQGRPLREWGQGRPGQARRFRWNFFRTSACGGRLLSWLWFWSSSVGPPAGSTAPRLRRHHPQPRRHQRQQHHPQQQHRPRQRRPQRLLQQRSNYGAQDETRRANSAGRFIFIHSKGAQSCPQSFGWPRSSNGYRRAWHRLERPPRERQPRIAGRACADGGHESGQRMARGPGSSSLT